MRARRQEHGGHSVEYVGMGLVVVALVGGLITTGTVERVADACVTAYCRLLSMVAPGAACGDAGDVTAGGAPADAGDPAGEGDAPGDDAAPADGGGGGGGGGGDPGTFEPLAGPAEDDAGPGDGAPTGPRPPLPEPECTPDPDVPWTEGLHSHNDYDNGTPLQDALDHGATSVEVDVWLDENGEVVVRHDQDGETRGTLRELYTDPLAELTRRNGGQVYPGRDRPFQVLIEIKDGENAQEVYRRTVEQLGSLPPGVRVVVDPGNRPEEEIGRQPPNVFFNATPSADANGCHIPERLDPGSPAYDPAYARNFTMLNGGYRACADPNDDGEVDEQEQENLNRFVAEAHAAGYEVRVVEGPDGDERGDDPGEFRRHGFLGFFEGEHSEEAQEEWWRHALEAGVDYVDTQHLTAGRDFLRSCGEG